MSVVPVLKSGDAVERMMKYITAFEKNTPVTMSVRVALSSLVSLVSTLHWSQWGRVATGKRTSKGAQCHEIALGAPQSQLV